MLMAEHCTPCTSQTKTSAEKSTCSIFKNTMLSLQISMPFSMIAQILIEVCISVARVPVTNILKRISPSIDFFQTDQLV